METCMFCKICDRANSNEKGEVWCEAIMRN